ncbi:MAG TPA: hypothetical protein ENJ88_10905 [Phaeodactylibacter sp.]|nr:hypothetical protein [Phaeodactylibacter sp.]
MSGTRKSLGNFITLLVMFPLSIGVNILVARILGPANKGLYAFMVLLGESMLPILFLGFGVGVVYLLGSERFKGRDVVFSSLVIGFLNGAVVALLLAFLWSKQWLGKTAAEVPGEFMLPVLMTLPLTGMFSMAKQILKGRSQFKVLNILTLANALFNIALLSAFVLLTDMALRGAVMAIVVQKVLTAVVVVYLLARYTSPRLKFNPAFVRESYAYGIKAWLGNMATRSNERMDQLILSFFADARLLGYYSVAFSIVRLMGFFPQAISPVLFNMVAKAKDAGRSAVLLAQVHRALLLLVGGMALALGLAGKWLIPFLYGSAYEASYLPMLILLPGMFVYMASRRVINKFLSANGHPGLSSRVEAIGALTGIVAYLLLIPVLGVAGAALASSLAYVVSTIAAHYYLHRLLPDFRTADLFLVGKKDLTWLYRRVLGALGR